MDAEPPTGDDLNRMLVSMKQGVLQRAAETPPARPRPWARRHLGLTLGLVALLGIGGAGGAAALLLPSPFEAAPAAVPTGEPEPTTTPSATATPSTPRPVEPETATVPEPALPLSCGELATRIDLGSFVPRAKEYDPGSYFPSEAASSLQAGVLECHWYPDGNEYADYSLGVVVSPAGDRGREWISGLSQSGLPSLGVGDVSAANCDPEFSPTCNTSTVAGEWWIETSARSTDAGAPAGDPAAHGAVVASVVAAIGDTTPPAPWVAPETSWTDTTCADLARADVAGVADSPLLTGPTETDRSQRTGILRTQSTAVDCSWSVGPDTTDDSMPLSWTTTTFAPGSGWAFGTRTPAGEAVTVAGADAASYACLSFEGAACTLDLLVDDTWVAVAGTYDPGAAPDPADRDRLVAVAEAVLAAQRG